MSKKQATAPAECLKMNIELADNGIIIRNPENEDDITLAMTGKGTRSDDGYMIDHSDEHRAIGKMIFNWLTDVVIPEHDTELIITNFDIEINAVAKGREF